MPQPMVEIDGITVSYGHTTVGPVSLSVEDGEFVSLLGPSGCGKTTTLRAIAGFERPSSGDIRVHGRSVVRLPPHKRNVGFVFQNYALFPHLSVADNIAFGPRRRGVAKRVIAARVEEMIGRLGLAGLGERLPAQLSGGQQQRVALGRALAFDPDVLLLDEPLSNLDRKLRVQLRAELRRIHREFRKTVIFVTHDQEEALSLSDRIAVMMGGRIVQVGTPKAIYETPADPAIADFIGDCRLYRARVVGCDPAADAATFEMEGGVRWTIPLAGRPAAIGDWMTVALRAEAVRLASAGAADETNRFEVAIIDRFYVGDGMMLLCRLGAKDEIPVPVPGGHPAQGLERGSMIRCEFDPTRACLFAAEGAA